jgi:hypothetical protein
VVERLAVRTRKGNKRRWPAPSHSTPPPILISNKLHPNACRPAEKF